MPTLRDIECGLRDRGLTSGQVVAAIEGARRRIAAGGHPLLDTTALARELDLESPYFWGVFETLPDEKE